MSLNFNFNDQVAIVTGASRGIGRAIANGFAKLGCSVAMVSRNLDDLKKVKSEIENGSIQVECFSCDISNFDEVQATIAQIHDTFGKISFLINNAGLTRDNLILRIKENDWDAVIDVNLKGCFNTIKAATKPMIRAKSGRIINITSVVGLIGNAGQANYAASKSGILGLTKSIAKELGSRNITVNAIAPGYFETDMTEQLTDKVKSELQTNIPLRRLGQPEEITDLVMFLCSEKASYITGQTINVDGGMVM